jgi:LysR family transcriptional regulator, benzoate and cis,cis-muconate-responsive activator of ben and cat genes
MDIRQLQYFIAVAEEGGFRRAAARLNITQPPLSLQIQALERSIGVALFDRGGHKIKLTSAGEALLRRSRAIVEAIGNARQETLRVGRGEVGRLVVGVMSGALLGRLSPLLAAFREAAPDVDVAIDQRSPADQIAAIARGEIDVGVLALSPKFKPTYQGISLASEQLWQEELAIALPGNHPLAKRAELPLKALANERFVSIVDSPEIGYHRQVLTLCRKAGFSPAFVHRAHQLPHALTMIAAGYGVGLIPACMIASWSPQVVFRQPSSPASIAVSMIWREAGTTPPIELFRETARREIAGRYFPLNLPPGPTKRAKRRKGD